MPTRCNRFLTVNPADQRTFGEPAPTVQWPFLRLEMALQRQIVLFMTVIQNSFQDCDGWFS
jgi:hypothetical protein